MILLVVLAALPFPAEPFLPLHGGQDQGVYVSMSAHLQRKGSVFIDDPLPDVLPDDMARAVYHARMWRGRPQAAQPGIHQSRDRGEYVWHWQFYHLHPLWMATFAELFGDRARFYPLTFFSLLSIVGLCLLALEMTGSRMAALVTGLLLALNPLHVFFSRLDVTEIVAPAFSSMGFHYLARAARGVQGGAPPATTASLAALSTLSLSLVFFVRITGFLYLPLVVLVYGLGVRWTAQHRPAYTRQVIGYGALVGTLYALTVVYGPHYSPVYSRVLIYYDLFGGLLGAHWQATLVGFTERYPDVPLNQWADVIGAGTPTFWQTGAAGCLLFTSPLLALIGIRPGAPFAGSMAHCAAVLLSRCMPVRQSGIEYPSHQLPLLLRTVFIERSRAVQRRPRRHGDVSLGVATVSCIGRGRDCARHPVAFVPHGSTDGGPRSRACANAHRCGAR